MTAWFWILAALMLAVTVWALLAPIMRRGEGAPRYATVLFTALGIPALTLGLYLAIGQWQTQAPQQQQAHESQPELEAMVAALAGRLQQQGGTPEEWVMLGRSYMSMGRYPDAVAAFARARQLAAGDDPELLAQYAEALVLADRQQLAGEAARLFEEVLAARADDPRGLWYGGLAAEARDDLELALSRFERLGSRQVPDAIRQALDQRITDLRTRLGAGRSASPADVAGPVIRVEVAAGELGGERVAPDTPVFVLARDPGGRMPLAIERLRFQDLPRTVELSQRNAMVGGEGLAGKSEVEVVARIALGGGAISKSGDWFGIASVKLPEPAPIKIRIDERVE